MAPASDHRVALLKRVLECPNPDTEWLKLVGELFGSGLPTMVPLLPALLNLEGRPYTLDRHFQFEPMFATWSPRKQVWRTGRQLGKSRSMGARLVALSAIREHYRSLCITPLQEQIHRFSNDYVAPFIEDSPIRGLLRNDGRSGSVLRRAFKNRSVIYFSYAHESADRVRGLSVKLVTIDEAQHINPKHLPIINETMSAFPTEGTTFAAGTSTTRESALENMWSESSQAEWVTKCQACNYYNIASIDHDLIKMIGPVRADISDVRPGLVCARCGGFLYPHLPGHGRWQHRHPERANHYAGYHLPQPVTMAHYASAEAWGELHGKMAGRWNYTTAKFLNEALGEPSDDAVKLVSKTDLEKAGCLHPNTLQDAVRVAGYYTYRVLSVDWGGGGKDGLSKTALAVLGVKPNGEIDVLYGKRLPNPDDHLGEAAEALRLFAMFKCHIFVHDFGGAGALRETFVVQAGLPINRIVPVAYVGPYTHKIISFTPGTPDQPRQYWTVDKSRSLQLTCYALKLGVLKTFKYDFIDAQEPGLLHDFLSLIEMNIPSARSGNIYSIISHAALPDDFAQAVNIGCMVLWCTNGRWPDFARHLIIDRGGPDAPG